MARGHYNRALILGELGNYDEAAFEMKKYLALEPEAPDARADAGRDLRMGIKIEGDVR